MLNVNFIRLAKTNGIQDDTDGEISIKARDIIIVKQVV